jgi:hypothetical protein
MPQREAIRQRDKMVLMAKPNGSTGDILISEPEALHRRNKKEFLLMQKVIAIGFPRIDWFYKFRVDAQCHDSNTRPFIFI